MVKNDLSSIVKQHKRDNNRDNCQFNYTVVQFNISNGRIASNKKLETCRRSQQTCQ